MRNNTRVGSRQLSENQVLRLGRTLRRFSRTSREMMKLLGVEDTEVRIPRKKKRPQTRLSVVPQADGNPVPSPSGEPHMVAAE